MSKEEDKSSTSSTNSSNVSNTLCEVYQELLMKKHLSITDQCPVCQCLVGRHKHSPISSATNSNDGSDDISEGKLHKRDGTKSDIPKWKDYKHVKPFLDRMERVLEADLVDENHWPRLLMKATEGFDSSWIKKHIVDTKLKWKEARKKFAEHFERYSYDLELRNKYESIHQLDKESTQKYADRYLNLIEELGYEKDHELIIQHFITKLSPENNMEFKKYMTTLELSTDISEIMNSLDSVMEIAIKLDAINYNYSSTKRSTDKNDSTHSNHGNNHSSKNRNHSGFIGHKKFNNRKFCQYHPHSSTHNVTSVDLHNVDLCHAYFCGRFVLSLVSLCDYDLFSIFFVFTCCLSMYADVIIPSSLCADVTLLCHSYSYVYLSLFICFILLTSSYSYLLCLSV